MSAITLERRPVHLPFSRVAAVGLGNALSFYDFLTFSFFAIQIGRTFFPSGDATHSLLYTLATFGVGFLTRPVGGMVIGVFADRAGRKPAMILTFALMGAGIIGVALTPGYASIGVAAPILLTVFRLVQGFALGGEVGPSTAFLVEAAPPRRRGLYLALQFATQDLAVLAAGIVGYALSSRLTPAELDSWGWRAAFLIGASIVPFGLWMRKNLPETLEPVATRAERQRAPTRVVILGLAIIAPMMIANYTLIYMTTYAQDALKLAASGAFAATIVLGLAQFTCDVSSGLLADRFGRKPVMLAAAAGLILVTPPAYLLMIRYPTVGAVFAVTAVLGALVSLASSPGLMSVTESLPKAVRSGVLGSVYAFAVAGFGGTTQFMIKWISGVTHSAMTPAWYMAIPMVVAAAAMLAMPETAPVRTGRMEDI